MIDQWRQRAVELLYSTWGTRIIAFLVATVLFVVTRNEVTKVFTVPLRVVRDPDRVLLTDLPDTFQVELRGPWTRVNRLQDYDLDVVTLDLRQLRPGPLVIDPSAVSMPQGVVLQRIISVPADLRFEPVIERAMAIVVPLVGTPDLEHRLVRVDVEPERWTVRGGRSAVQGIVELRTETVDITGASSDVHRELRLQPLATGVRYVGIAESDAPVVRATADLEPIPGERAIQVPIAIERRMEGDGVPTTYQVRVHGPLPAVRKLGDVGTGTPVLGRATRPADEPDAIELVFAWAADVPESLRQVLAIDPLSVRIPRESSAGRERSR